MNGEQFCIYDSGIEDSDQIIIFSTKDFLLRIEYFNCWLGESTIKSIPKEFS